MWYLSKQFFYWGLTGNLCTAVFIALISLFDDNLQNLGLQMALFCLYLWPFSSIVGIALRCHLLKRSGEWLSLQCMGWSVLRVMLSAVFSGIFLGLAPLILSFMGWKNLIDLSSQQLEWIWSNGSAIQVSSGLTINLSGIQMSPPKIGLDFAPVWMSITECDQGFDCALESQRRLVRCLTTILMGPLGVACILFRNKRLPIVGLGLLMALLSCMPNQTGPLLWLPISFLSLGLYVLGSRT